MTDDCVDAATAEPALTASARMVRHPDRHLDSRGVVVGPWSDSVKRTTDLLRSASVHPFRS